jgi:histone acetyltransferase MYST2
MDPHLVQDAGKEWTCQICLDDPLPANTQLVESTEEKLDPETSTPEQDTDESKPIPKSSSPSRGKHTRRKRTLKFAYRKNSKYKNVRSKSDENMASTESEESEGGSLSEVSPSSSPMKEPDYRTLNTSFKSYFVRNSSIHKKCPTQGCDGKGHLTGKFSLHHTTSGCPKYHDTTAEECKVIHTFY